MNILLTNDDGYQSKGLLLLKEKLAKFGHVIVVAPFEHQSGKGASLDSWNGNKLHIIDKDFYAVSGTPVDCVIFALGFLNIKFDLLVSGCNDGWNISIDTMYSGTCGAAFQGVVSNIKSVAISCKNKDNFEQIDKYVEDTFKYIFENKLLSKKYYLNVNLPDKDKLYKGIILTKTLDQTFSYFVDTKKSHDDIYVFKRVSNKKIDTLSDVFAVNNGYISISPMKKTTFSKTSYQTLARKLQKK